MIRMKLTEYSSNGSNSSNGGSVVDGTPTSTYTISGTTPGNGNGATGGHPKKGGKKPPRYDPFEMRDKSKATTCVLYIPTFTLRIFRVSGHVIIVHKYDI